MPDSRQTMPQVVWRSGETGILDIFHSRSLNMADKVTVSAIQIEFPDGTTKPMSIEDARALHQQLNELFGVKVQQVVREVVVERDRWPRWLTTRVTLDSPQTEHRIPERPRRIERPQIWCAANEGSAMLAGGEMVG